MFTCLYCHTKREHYGTACPGCGSRLTLGMNAGDVSRSVRPVSIETFAYNGYIVWPLYDVVRKECEWAFYLGRDLIVTVRVTEEELRAEMSARGMDEYSEYMPIVWDWFCQMGAPAPNATPDLTAMLKKHYVNYRGDVLGALQSIATCVGWDAIAKHAAWQVVKLHQRG